MNIFWWETHVLMPGKFLRGVYGKFRTVSIIFDRVAVTFSRHCHEMRRNINGKWTAIWCFICDWILDVGRWTQYNIRIFNLTARSVLHIRMLLFYIFSAWVCFQHGTKIHNLKNNLYNWKWIHKFIYYVCKKLFNFTFVRGIKIATKLLSE